MGTYRYPNESRLKHLTPEQCAELKRRGMPQVAHFYYPEQGGGLACRKDVGLVDGAVPREADALVACPTLEELLGRMPKAVTPEGPEGPECYFNLVWIDGVEDWFSFYQDTAGGNPVFVHASNDPITAVYGTLKSIFSELAKRGLSDIPWER